MQVRPQEVSRSPMLRRLPQTGPSTTNSSDEFEVGIVPTDDVEKYWPLVEGYIESAIPRAVGRLTVDDVHRGLVGEGRYGLWIVGSAEKGVVGCGVSEILEYSTKRILFVFLYAGERQRVMKLWPIVEDVARALDCDEVQIAGPRAWGRIFPDFDEAFTVFTKEVR